MLNWRPLCTSYDRRYMVKGTELSQALVGPHSRFAIVDVRCYGEDGYADVRYRVRDADTVSDAEVRDGVRPRIVHECWTLDEALDWVAKAAWQSPSPPARWPAPSRPR